MSQFQKGVLISSSSEKIPLIEVVRKAAYSLGAFQQIHGCDSNGQVISRYFVDHFWEVKPLVRWSRREIMEYCHKHEIGAIIPTRDGELDFFAKERDFFFSEGIAVLVSSQETVKVCQDKLLFYNTLAEWGMPVVPTLLAPPSSDDQRWVVKERYASSDKFKGVGIRHEEVETFAERVKDPLFQPFIEGQEYSVDVYRDFKGEVVGAISRERNLIARGESQVSTIVSKPEIEEMASMLASKMNLEGPAVFQGIETREGEFLFLECNPRFGGASTLTVEAGLDPFKLFFSACLGVQPSKPILNKTEALKLIRYPKDFFVK